jgi:hypothetical protein
MTIFDNTAMQAFANFGETFLLKDDCDILRDTEGTLDAMGGSTHTWPVVATVKSDVADWKPPSEEYVIAHQVVGKVLKKVKLPLGTTVLKSDHLAIKGTVYKVVEAVPDSSYSIFTEIVGVITTLGV